MIQNANSDLVVNYKLLFVIFLIVYIFPLVLIGFGRGRHLRAQTQQIIVNVREFFEKENRRPIFDILVSATQLPRVTLLNMFKRFSNFFILLKVIFFND